MPSAPLYFVHISDTHIGPTPEYELYGANTYSNALRMVEAINTLPVRLDFVLHTGDITSHPDEHAYTLAADVFARLRVPIYFVTGNHDSAELIKKFLRMGEVETEGADRTFLTYAFEKKGLRFITLDGRGPDEIDPRGVLAVHQFDFLKQELERDVSPLVVFVHFPPLRLDSRWLDKEMLLINGEILHQMLVPYRERVRGVFHGHVHRGIQTLKDGIFYSSVASTIGQFSTWPDDPQMQLDTGHPPCFHFVTLLHEQTIVKEHVLT